MLYCKINQDLYFIKDNPKKILYIWNKNYKLATPDSHSAAVLYRYKTDQFRTMCINANLHGAAIFLVKTLLGLWRSY